MPDPAPEGDVRELRELTASLVARSPYVAPITQVSPRTAVLIALLRAPIDARMWVALGAPYGVGWALARTAALNGMYVTVNGLSHVVLRKAYGRRLRRKAHQAAEPPSVRD